MPSRTLPTLPNSAQARHGTAIEERCGGTSVDVGTSTNELRNDRVVRTLRSQMNRRCSGFWRGLHQPLATDMQIVLACLAARYSVGEGEWRYVVA